MKVNIKKYSYKIIVKGFIALIIALLMYNRYFNNILINAIGLIILTFFIYTVTIKKGYVLGYLLILYFCAHFPYLQGKGGAFSLVAFTTAGMTLMLYPKKFLLLYKLRFSNLPKLLLIMFILSSIVGWFSNFAGSQEDLIYSFLSFGGLISIFILSSNLKWTENYFRIFFILNLFIITYSLFISINKYLRLVTFDIPLFPVYGGYHEYIEAGGIIGKSPLYGEHSMIMAIFFLAVLFTKKIKDQLNIKGKYALIGFIFSVINVFVSISRSVVLLTAAGVLLFIVILYILNLQKIKVQMRKLILLLSALSIVYILVNYFGLGYVISRLGEVNFKNINIKTLETGESINRYIAFNIAQERLRSRNWLIGYGYGITETNRVAWFVNPNIGRDSPHSQYYAMLFLFGWLGMISYFGLIIFLVYKLLLKLKKEKWRPEYIQSLSLFFILGFTLFLINEYKADAIAIPNYFMVTMIWLGMGYSLLKERRKKIIEKVNYTIKI